MIFRFVLIAAFVLELNCPIKYSSALNEIETGVCELASQVRQTKASQPNENN